MGSESNKPRVYHRFDADTKAAFLQFLSETGNLEASAAAAGIHPRTVYYHIKNTDGVREEVSQARAKACHAIEQEIARRGLHGISKPIYYQGQKVGEQAEYSDRLLLAMARANMGDRYSEKQHIVTETIESHAENAKQKLIQLLQDEPIEADFTEITDSRGDDNDS